MDEATKELAVDVTLTTVQQVSKLVIGSIAGYFASKAADKVFDQVIRANRLKDAIRALNAE